MKHATLCLGLLPVLAVAACAPEVPAGPSVMALPPAGKDYATFQQDDAICRITATQMTGGQSPGQAANNAAVGSALVGTALGAGLGAALGSLSGAAGAGAAIGGATGALMGTASGANNAAWAAAGVQQRYDAVYTQCMYAKGNAVQAPPPAYAVAPVPYPYAPVPATPYVPGFVGYPAVVASPTIVVGGGYGWGGYPRRWGWGGPGWGYRRW